MRLVPCHGSTKERIAGGFDLLELDEALPDERPDHGAGVLELCAKLFEQDRPAIREVLHQLLLPCTQSNALGALAGGGHLPRRVVGDPLTGKILGRFEKAVGAQATHRARRKRRSRGTQDLAERVHVVLRSSVQEPQKLRGEHRLGFEKPRDRKRARHPVGEVFPPAHHEPRELSAAERDRYATAPPEGTLEADRHVVREHLAKRNRQGHFDVV